MDAQNEFGSTSQNVEVSSSEGIEKSRDVIPQRMRRRTRMITTCLECRRRKLRCDKLHPCSNCHKSFRDCVFLAPALNSVSQARIHGITDIASALDKTVEEDAASEGYQRSTSHQQSSMDVLANVNTAETGFLANEDERNLEPTTLAVIDATYEDDANDDMEDLGVRIGKMRITERIGGMFRPKLSDEARHTLHDPMQDRRTEEEKLDTVPELLDDHTNFLEPGPSYIAPGWGFFFGDVGPQRDLIELLPTKDISDLLVSYYYENVHFIARVLHWPSFQLQYEHFWMTVMASVEPPTSQQALILAVLFSAIASLSETDCLNNFGVPRQTLQTDFQRGAEVALTKARFLRTTKIETIQAIVIYLIPMCRDQMSRAHSVLVGAVVRLAECVGLHRDPIGLSPVESHIRRILWYQVCFLDFRTADSQGPRPYLRYEDYSTKLPLNINDVDLISLRLEETNTRFTDMTLCMLRFECIEMQRMLWFDRIRLEKKEVTLTQVLGKIESFRKQIEAKYIPILDRSIPIQLYAYWCLRLLVMRLHIMVLHRYLNNASSKVPDRLRQIILSSGAAHIEAAYELETIPSLQQWRWYNGAHQQWHTALLLMVEVYAHPYRREADRIWKVLDFVFEPNPSDSRAQKARAIMTAVQNRTGLYRDLRRTATPAGMRMEDIQKMYQVNLTAAQMPQEQGLPVLKRPAARPSMSASRLGQSIPIDATASTTEVNQASTTANRSWSFESAQTLFWGSQQGLPNIGQLPGFDHVQQISPNTPMDGDHVANPNIDFRVSSHSGSMQDSWPSSSHNTIVQRSMQRQMTMSSNPMQHPLPYPAVIEAVPPTTGISSLYSQQQETPDPTSLSRQTSTSDDSLMLSIDWNEWDAIFPPDENTGDINMTPPE